MSKAPDPVFVLRGTNSPINSLSFIQPNPENDTIRYLSSGNQKGQVSIWDLKVRGTHFEWDAHNSSVLWLKYLDSSNLWTCGRNESVILWDINENLARVKATFPIGEYLGFSQCDVIIFEDQVLLCVPGPSQEGVTIWDAKSCKKISCIIPSDPKAWGCVMQCKWAVCSKHLFVLAIYENGTIALWDWSNCKVLSETKCNDNLICLEFDSLLMRGICGTASEIVYPFSIHKESLKIDFEQDYKIINPGIGCARGRPDGKLYAIGGWDYRLRLYSWKKHKPLAVMIYHKKSIECLDYSQASVETFGSGFLLAAGSSDNSISLWNAYN